MAKATATRNATTRNSAMTSSVARATAAIMVTMDGVRISAALSALVQSASAAVKDARTQLNELEKLASDVLASSYDRAELVFNAWVQFVADYKAHGKATGQKLKPSKHAFYRLIDPTIPEKSEEAQGHKSVNAIAYLFRVHERYVALTGIKALTDAKTPDEKTAAREALTASGATKRALVAAIRASDDLATKIDLTDLPSDVRAELTNRKAVRKVLSMADQRNLALALLVKVTPTKVQPDLWTLIGRAYGMDDKMTGKMRDAITAGMAQGTIDVTEVIDADAAIKPATLTLTEAAEPLAQTA